MLNKFIDKSSKLGQMIIKLILLTVTTYCIFSLISVLTVYSKNSKII